MYVSIYVYHLYTVLANTGMKALKVRMYYVNW